MGILNVLARMRLVAAAVGLGVLLLLHGRIPFAGSLLLAALTIVAAAPHQSLRLFQSIGGRLVLGTALLGWLLALGYSEPPPQPTLILLPGLAVAALATYVVLILLTEMRVPVEVLSRRAPAHLALGARGRSRDGRALRPKYPAMRELGLSQITGRFAIARLAGGSEVPAWAVGSSTFRAIVQTAEELSIVLPEAAVPERVRAERGWACLRVDGPVDFTEVGVLASIAEPLAAAGISIFAVSTYDTDYVLVREPELAATRRALSSAGHVVSLL